jgi:hypothetical protein
MKLFESIFDNYQRVELSAHKYGFSAVCGRGRLSVTRPINTILSRRLMNSDTSWHSYWADAVLSPKVSTMSRSGVPKRIGPHFMPENLLNLAI